MKIHTTLGKGFKEVIYKDAMEIEFKNADIPYEREKQFNIQYEGIMLPHRFDADFLVFQFYYFGGKSNMSVSFG